jgi:sulfite exporter TauE/SafE
MNDIQKRTGSEYNYQLILISLLSLAGLVVIIISARKFGHRISMPEINSQTGAGLIILTGLLTGLHCIGMCGSFIIGYTAHDTENDHSSYKSHMLFGTGKIISYTLMGALFGLAGSVFRITPLISGISISLAGFFLMLYGLNMLKIFKSLKIFHFKQPRKLTCLAKGENTISKGPFYIGLFSGLIIGCGPLQAMYVLAAGNGSITEGGKFLALFAFGTLPPLLGFGLIARLLSDKMTRNLIRASGIILIVLGAMMLNKGLSRAAAIEKSDTMMPACNCQKKIINYENGEVK